LSDKQEMAVKSRSLSDVLVSQLVNHEVMLRLAKRNRQLEERQFWQGEMEITDSWTTYPNYTTDLNDQVEEEQLRKHTNLHAG